MGSVIRDLFAALGLVAIFAAGLVYFGLRYAAIRRDVEKRIEREVVAKRNPYKQTDIQFMVDAGMTPEQIEQAIRNSISDSARKRR